ncbi:MAG: hypothetical protein ACM3YN_02265 [Parcubacteria group bacterium]
MKTLLFDYVKSPSLRHIRDPYMLVKLAQQIIKAVDRGHPIWRKWEAPREALVKAAAGCWAPIEDLRDYLNEMDGPSLTTTDVDQRLRALYEDSYTSYPDEDLQAGCLALYEKEKAQGTELPAIIGALQEHVEREQERLRQEREAAWRRRAEEERIALEQRFLSGADCKWTSVQKSKTLYCRMNGRAYRLSPTPDKMWELHRIASIEDVKGIQIGKYRHRGDVTKALAQVAYQPEPRW